MKVECLKQKTTYFVQQIKNYNSTEDTFNPWKDYDPLYDCTPDAPTIRTAHLTEYLKRRVGRAKYLLVAEAVGYQGAKFSGVPLVSERILLGNQEGINVRNIMGKFSPARTSSGNGASSKAVKRLGYAEPTATIVWDLVQQLSLSPMDTMLWNIFPFHPFKKEQGMLSNRTPRMSELSEGKEYLDLLMKLCSLGAKIIAIGEKSASVLGEKCLKVRHPANGGATLFRKQLPLII